MAGFRCSVREIFRQNLNSKIPPEGMKLNNTKVQRITVRWQKGLPTELLAQQFQVSQRRIQQLIRDFKRLEQVPRLSSQGRKPYAKHPENTGELVRILHLRHKMGANYLAKLLRDKYHLRISNGTVHAILRKNNRATEQLNKQKRRKAEASNHLNTESLMRGEFYKSLA